MKYKSCTDYVFDFVSEEPQLRGEFEQMYQDIEDPWTCKERMGRIDNVVFRDILFHGRAPKRVLDIGCGFGDVLNTFGKTLDAPELVGLEISQTACDKGAQQFPHIDFHCLNILNQAVDHLGQFDTIMMAEVLWYILDDVQGVHKKIENMLAPGGLLGINQYFPANQRLGRKVIDNLCGYRGFIRYQTGLEFKDVYVSDYDDGVVLLATLQHKEK